MKKKGNSQYIETCEHEACVTCIFPNAREIFNEQMSSAYSIAVFPNPLYLATILDLIKKSATRHDHLSAYRINNVIEIKKLLIIKSVIHLPKVT